MPLRALERTRAPRCFELLGRFSFRRSSCAASGFTLPVGIDGLDDAAARDQRSLRGPSIVRGSPSRILFLSAVTIVPVASKDHLTAETQGLPIPRHQTAPWLVIPPKNVTTPTEASTPWISSGVISTQRKTAGSPLFCSLTTESDENAATPLEAPGLAGSPLPSSRTFGLMITLGSKTFSIAAGSIRRTRVLPLILPSRNRSVAMRTAAASVRLPTRASKT